MKTLLKGIKVIYPTTEWDGKTFDILVSDGKIEALSNEPLEAKGATIIEAQSMICIPALVDVQCAAGEPGNEHKENLDSLLRAAAAGGFSDVFVLPNTQPAVDSQAQIRYVKDRSRNGFAKAHAYGAISKGLNGIELSEMYDMFKAGAVAFTDGKQPIADVNLMKRALDYAKGFGALVCSFPMDDRINPGGYVHEGPVATRLGLKPTPTLAEELMLNRDLALLAYTQSKMHVATISTRGSVDLMAKARENQLDVSCAVALPNLLFTDAELSKFDSLFKTNPALRDQSHQDALITGLKTGAIDMICTDHSPENIENKAVEMDNAAFGMTMLEVAFAKAYAALSQSLGVEKLVELMSINPRKRFQLGMPILAPSKAFDFAVFDPTQAWNYDRSSLESKSHNSPYFGQSVQGKIIKINT